ncbi:hypothetical protein PC121_g11923 [Phytophthora cactorum]|nr:hypothetical protein PC120_g10912 [Phytophthora cactorum]KAG3063995.1 hypothetical protein PC121_g11923 [Phytophthora cactorum]KAG4054144.1 hypothetical protein PC123_g10725 [Phytophthora cactorum]
MSFKKPTTSTLGGLSSVERSFSSSSLLTSPSKQGSASPRIPQKSFGRQPARVAATPVSPVAAAPAAPVVARTDTSSSITLSLDDTEFAHGLQQEVMRDSPSIEDKVDHKQENTDLRAELEVLRQELQDLLEASSKNDEVWQRDNARLKEQLSAAIAREASQQELIRIRDDQLALCREELRELQEHQLNVEEERAAVTHPPAEDAGTSGLGRERELLKLVVQLVGAANVRTVLRENSNASPSQLRQALVRLRCSQCRLLSPSRAKSPSKSTGSGSSESLHKMLFGTSSQPPSPTAIRFNSMGPRSPHH